MKFTERYLRQAIVECGIPEYEYNIIVGNSRFLMHIEKRKLVAEKMRSYGLSYPQIAEAMQRHHTSVIALISGKRRKKMKNNALSDAILMVQRHQEWRRGANIPMADVKELGIAIDKVLEAAIAYNASIKGDKK